MTASTRTWYVDIATVPLSTPAWDVLNIEILTQGPTVRGDDRLLPGAAGVRARPRRSDVTHHSLEMIVRGNVDKDGGTYANAATGLLTNLAYLRTNVTDPTNTGDGTRTMTLHYPDGSTTVSASVHVEGFTWQAAGKNSVRAVMDISIPTGALA